MNLFYYSFLYLSDIIRYLGTISVPTLPHPSITHQVLQLSGISQSQISRTSALSSAPNETTEGSGGMSGTVIERLGTLFKYFF